MRKGLRFQTKLMLTLVAAIFSVTVAILSVTEAKVKQAYTKQFSRDFNQLVNHLEASRLERSHDFMELCRRLASHPYVVSSLTGEPTSEENAAFWRTYISSLQDLNEGIEKRPDSPAKRPTPPAEILNRVGTVAIMTPSGEISSLPFPSSGTTPSVGEKRRLLEKRIRYNAAMSDGTGGTKTRLEDLLSRERQETLYIPFDSAIGTGFVQEMVSTPVKDPESGAIIGLFLRAASAETEAQRFVERYQQEFDSTAPLRSGIYMAGQLYSRNLDAETAEGMAAVLSRKLPFPKSRPGTEATPFDTVIGGSPYRLFVAPLTGESSFDTAYQVSAFSLATVESDLAELRVWGSGIGLFALLLGLGMALLLSRNLAIPIRELTRATEAVKSGDLETRITIRTWDEIGELAASFNEMAKGLRQRAIFRDILGKVSDETVAQAMISGDLDPELGGELKTVSILFCDIRGFTAITEHMPPDRVIHLLNRHMTAMTSVVRSHFGVVDKFIGDEIMAVFGALKSYGNDAGHAAACAIDMIRECERLNRETREPVEIGIGIATGEVVAGCMGSVDRLNYTVLGSRVNLASRLCNEAGGMEVLIDDQTFDRLEEERVEATAMSDLRLKGFSETVTAYRLRERETALVP